jgi:hypothetical protein
MRSRSAAFPVRKRPTCCTALELAEWGNTRGSGDPMQQSRADRPGAGLNETPSVFRPRRFLDTIDSLAAFLSSGPPKTLGSGSVWELCAEIEMARSPGGQSISTVSGLLF